MTREPESTTPLAAVKGSLAKRRAEIVEDLFLELEVPHYDDPPVKVRFRPVEYSVITSGRKKIEKASKNDQGDVEVRVNADLLVKACDGISSGDDSWTGFGDAGLAEELDVTEQRAVAVCRALYVTEGDLISHAEAVIRFSGYRQTEIDEDAAGE